MKERMELRQKKLKERPGDVLDRVQQIRQKKAAMDEEERNRKERKYWEHHYRMLIAKKKQEELLLEKKAFNEVMILSPWTNMS